MTYYPGGDSFPHGTFPLYTFPQYTFPGVYGSIPVVTYTGIIDLTARARDFALDVNSREYDGLDVRARDLALIVEDR